MRKFSATPRQEKKANRPVVVGDLRVSPRQLAADIQEAMVDSEHLVWADDHHTVFISRGSIPQVPDHWIIGTYLMGASTAGIAQDVAQMWHDRSKDFIID